MTNFSGSPCICVDAHRREEHDGAEFFARFLSSKVVGQKFLSSKKPNYVVRWGTLDEVRRGQKRNTCQEEYLSLGMLDTSAVKLQIEEYLSLGMLDTSAVKLQIDILTEYFDLEVRTSSQHVVSPLLAYRSGKLIRSIPPVKNAQYLPHIYSSKQVTESGTAFIQNANFTMQNISRHF